MAEEPSPANAKSAAHSIHQRLIDIAARLDRIQVAGIVQYHSKPRVSLGALAFLVALPRKYCRVHDVTVPVDLLQR